MLAFRPYGVGSAEDHDAFLRVGEAVPVLTHRASFFGCRLFVVSFFWPASLSQETFEELAVLVEVFDRVGVVGAWALHELMEVARRVLLGLLARVISCGDQRGVGRSAIFSILFPLLRGGALVLILALGLDFALASVGAR